MVSKPALQRLLGAYVVALCTHGLGLLTMALFVVPGMPGGPVPPLERVRYLASHPLLWKLGWLPWQLSALADLLLAAAWWGIDRIPAWLRGLIVVFTLAGVVPDQLGQWRWTTAASALAVQCLAAHDLAPYLTFEHNVFMMVCFWASLAYTALAVSWTLALSVIEVTSRSFVRYSATLWSGSALCIGMLVLPQGLQPPWWVNVGCNTLFFGGLMVWFGWVVVHLMIAYRATSAY